MLAFVIIINANFNLDSEKMKLDFKFGFPYLSSVPFINICKGNLNPAKRYPLGFCGFGKTVDKERPQQLREVILYETAKYSECEGTLDTISKQDSGQLC